MIDFGTVLINIFALILLTLPGFIVVKTKLSKDFSKELTALMLYISQPLLSFVSFQKINYSDEILKNLALCAVFSFLGLILAIIICFVFFKYFKTDKANIYKYGSVFSNCGFMGIPLVQSIFGNENPEIILYATVFLTFFNILNWTVGIYAITGEKSYISVKKAILNPPTIAFLISLPLFFLNIHISKYCPKIFSSLDIVANLITPLSMIMIGMKLAKIKLHTIFTSIKIYPAIFIKLIICPLIMLLIISPFDIDIILKTSLVFSMAMPSAATTVVFAEKFEKDSLEASKLVLASTLLSVITIPLMFLLI